MPRAYVCSAGDGNGKINCNTASRDDSGLCPDVGGVYGNPRPLRTPSATSPRDGGNTISALTSARWGRRHACFRLHRHRLSDRLHAFGGSDGSPQGITRGGGKRRGEDIQSWLPFFWWLAPFPFAGVPVVAGDAALNHFVAPFVACHDERGEIAAAKAKRAKGYHDDELQQLAHHSVLIPSTNGPRRAPSIAGVAANLLQISAARH